MKKDTKEEARSSENAQKQPKGANTVPPKKKPRINIANLLTVSRLPLLFFIVGLLYGKQSDGSATWALIWFTIGAWTDWLDGFLARRLKIQSSFGAFFDAVCDKIFMLGIFMIMLMIGVLPHWTIFLIVFILLREFLITALRAVAATHDVVISAEKTGKIKTVIQMVATFVLLLYNCLREDYPEKLSSESLWAVKVFGIFLFTVSALMTALSGITYIYKYRGVLVDL